MPLCPSFFSRHFSMAVTVITCSAVSLEVFGQNRRIIPLCGVELLPGQSRDITEVCAEE
jgi:hypothetical protein